jgi:O-antigen ligase
MVLVSAEWGCTLAAIGLWATERPPTGLMLLATPLWVAGWGWRWLRLGQPTRPTALDWPVVVFLLTALVSLWAAPDRAAALVRLNFFVGAVGLYYLLANGPSHWVGGFGYALGGLAALLGLYYASQHNWVSSPAKIALIDHLGQLFNRQVPQLGLYQPNANVVGSLLALALPIPVLQFMEGLKGRLAAALLAGLSALIITFGLVMTESRTSVLAVAGAASLAGWWWLTGQFERFTNGRRRLTFAAGVAGAAAIIGLSVVAVPNLLNLAFGSLPGPNSVVNRTEVFGQAWRLAQDTPFTGGGLASFPGLYSTYIVDVPALVLTHAHDAYLNILVEQGWPGLLSYLGVLAVAVWAAMRRLDGPAADGRELVAAGLLGLAVIILQGTGDGTLVASRVTLALLIPAGLAVGVESAEPIKPAWRLRVKPAWALAGLGGLVLIGLLTWRGWLSAWYANRGSLEFARVQLVGWPFNPWSDGHEVPQLLTSKPEFNEALAINPLNETAHYRLGLLAMLQRDFPTAVQHLALAHRIDSKHRGVLKALAYAYVWMGDEQQAVPLLRALPEAADEMQVYFWWWGVHGRTDLAERARVAAADLASAP